MTELCEPDDPHWHVAQMKGGGSIKVISITDSLSSGLDIGLDRNGNWVYSTAEGITRVGGDGRYVALLPILKLGKSAATEIIREGLTSKHIEADIPLNAFPFREIIKEGLGLRGYWAELALEVLERDELLKPDYEQLLAELAADKENTSQRTRHKAEKLLRRLRANNKNEP